MPFTLLTADDNINQNIKIKLDIQPIDGPVQVHGSSGGNIPIQFPPKLNTDGKTGNWKTYDASTYEPIAIYSGAEARRIQIELTYVIGAGSGWTGEKISNIERLIRSYFYMRVEDAVKNTPIVEITQLYGVVGKSARTTWRMKSMDVSFGEGLINDGNFTYPLSRKITMELETYTKLAGRQGGSKAAAEAQKAQASSADNKDAPAPKEADPQAKTTTTGESGSDSKPSEAKQMQDNLQNRVENFWY